MNVLRILIAALVGWWIGVQIMQALADMFGPEGGAVAFLVLVVLVLVLRIVRWRLRLEHPWVWWPVFGAIAALVRMGWSWRATCEGLGLSVPAKRFSQFGVIGGNGRRGGGGLIVKGEPLKLVAPRRIRVRFSRCALVVVVRLHPGQVPAQWERAGEAFAHQWRVHRVRVVSERPGFVTLTGLGFDPLRFPRPPRKAPPPDGSGSRLLPGPDSGGPLKRSDYAVIPGVLVVEVGIGEDGQPWVIDLSTRPHYLVTGATRSGKSTLTVRLVSELAQRPVILVGIDAKNGMELAPFGARLSALATSRAEAAAAIEGLIGLMYLRTMLCREYGARSIWELPTEVRPEPVVVVIDEVAELFLAVDKNGKEEANRCANGLVRIGQLGAALGVHLWVAGQRFGSDLGPGATLVRAQLSGRICHRVADPETASMTLAGLPPESIGEAQRIGADLAGVAVVGDDSGAWSLARSSPVSMEVAKSIAAQTSPLAVALPEVAAAIEQVRVNGGGW
jgi:S-DNA-T family DNA segregation ATPase FtsK/SpoIIIE